MRFSPIFRLTLLIVGLGVAGALSAQSINFWFNSSVTFPSFPPYPYTSDYVQCVAPAERQQEDSFVQLQRIYEQNSVILVERRGQSRIEAWMIPERSARSRAIRDSDRAFRDAERELDRWFRDQEKAIKRQFKDAEDICDDQFDTDVDYDGDGSSSRSSSSRSSSFSSYPICGNGKCEEGEWNYCPPCTAYDCENFCYPGNCPQDCGYSSFSSSRFSSSSRSSSSRSSSRSSSSVFVSCFSGDACVPVTTCNAIGGTFVSPGACGNQSQMQAGYYCCRQSSSSSRWSSSSSWYWSSSYSWYWSSASSWVFQPNEDTAAQRQEVESCGCEMVCDPSGSPCMAVCSAQC